MSASGSGQLDSNGPSVARFEVDIPALFVKRVTLGSDQEISTATFGVHPQGADQKDLRFQKVWKTVKKGQQVKVTMRSGQNTPEAVFFGWITEAQIRAGGHMEDVEYTAVGLEWGLRVEKIFGSWCRNKDGDKAVWLRATQTVFNKDGKYNKHTKELKDDDGNVRLVFDLDDDVDNKENAWWPASKMVRYCVSCERKGELSDSEGNLFKTTDTPGAELADFRPFDVNVEDEDIWGALVKIGARCAYGVRMKYGKSRDKPQIVFFSKKLAEAHDKKQFEFPDATLDAVSVKDYGRLLGSLDIQDDVSGIVRQVDAITPAKLFEGDFKLLPGWSQADEDAAFGGGDTLTKLANFLKETDPQASSDFARFQYVGRRYILNETGRDAVKGKAEPWDFSELFGEDWTIRLRPFRHQLVSTSDDGTPLPIEVHATWPGQTDDVKLGESCELLRDRAGVYFRGRPLVLPYKALAIDDVGWIFPTQVTVRAVVQGDQDAPHDVSGVLSAEEMPVPTFGVLRLDDGFHENNVDTDADDDIRKKAQDLCDEAVAQHKEARLVGTVTIPWISRQFEVGDVVDKINGRDLVVKAQIAKVTYDAEQQSTEIALHYPEIDTQTHSRHHHPPVGGHLGAHSDRAFSVARDLLALRDTGDFSSLDSAFMELAARAAMRGKHTGAAEHVLMDEMRGLLFPEKNQAITAL